MKKITWILLLPLLFSFFSGKEEKPDAVPYIIPEQRFDILQEMGYDKHHDTITVPQFEISPQVTLGEYRKYLAVIKKDSSEKYYLSQFPDSTMGLPENYREYMTNDKYNSFPVIGVSWGNAMNYLRWRTVKANKDGIYDTIYRLPMMSEWVAAYRYFKTVDVLKNEMNHDYSDWTMSTFDETFYDFGSKKEGFPFDYIYFAKHDEAPVLQRKRVIGNSFHYSEAELWGFNNWYYYEFHGYAHISFRYVVKTILPDKMQHEKKYGVLKLWGLDK